MTTEKPRLTNAQQTAKIETLLKEYQGAFNELTKDAYQVPTTIYILKFPGPPGPEGAPHLVFIGDKLYDAKVLDEQILKAQKQPVVFVIRVLHYSLMKPSEIVHVAKNKKVHDFYLRYVPAQPTVAPRGNVPEYYPIGVGFKPIEHKGEPEAQIKVAAKFCHHATPFLDGKTMSIVFTMGGTLNHLHNYKLMVQSDDGTIASLDPGTGHTDVLAK